jgi:hypothetical protein
MEASKRLHKKKPRSLEIMNAKSLEEFEGGKTTASGLKVHCYRRVLEKNQLASSNVKSALYLEH